MENLIGMFLVISALAGIVSIIALIVCIITEEHEYNYLWMLSLAICAIFFFSISPIIQTREAGISPTIFSVQKSQSIGIMVIYIDNLDDNKPRLYTFDDAKSFNEIDSTTLFSLRFGRNIWGDVIESSKHLTYYK